MDFFRGSIPPNFISFCLANQAGDEPQPQTSTTTSIPNEPVPALTSVSGTIAAQVPHPTSPPFPPTKPPRSLSNTDSNTDVTAYADEKVRLLEEAQQTTHQQIDVRSQEDHEREEVAVSESMPKVPFCVEAGACATSLFFRTSTPTQDVANASAGLNLTQLETGLTIAPSSRTLLPELLTITSAAVEESAVSFLQHETDDGSSSCDAPKLLTGEIRVRYLDDSTGGEEAGDASSHVSGPPLYGFTPVGGIIERTVEGSSTEASDQVLDPMRPSTSAPQDPRLRELSGRSGAILKQYFDEDSSTVNFPLGHRTEAFTEPQIYHLLRVLTDETLRMSCTTMEQMVIGAVRGAPITSKPRTDHFKIGPGHQSEFSDSYHDEASSGSGTDTSGGASTSRADRELDSFNDSDSSAELALISQAFKEPKSFVPVTGTAPVLDPANEGFESAGQSSLDATLSEIRVRTTSTEPTIAGSGKMPKRKKRGHTRGVPMKEEFFSKIGRTRSFISGPADPLHNPYMVWCHICKKNKSVKTKGTLEILRHHRTEKHLRRDQRWRYEHLKSVHPVTGKVQHRSGDAMARSSRR